MIDIQTYNFNPFGTNCYLLWDGSREAVICDPSASCKREQHILETAIETNKLSVKAIILTHGHGDHICGAAACAEKYGAPVYMSAKDAFLCRSGRQLFREFGFPEYRSDFEFVDVHEEDKLRFGEHELIAIETPGHTPGGLCWLCISEKFLLSGDSLFRGSIGRTDMEGGDYDQLMESINGKLLGLAPDITLYPGHGPASSIAEEINNNPFLLPFNEKADWEAAAENAIEFRLGGEETDGE